MTKIISRHLSRQRVVEPGKETRIHPSPRNTSRSKTQSMHTPTEFRRNDRIELGSMARLGNYGDAMAQARNYISSHPGIDIQDPVLVIDKQGDPNAWLGFSYKDTVITDPKTWATIHKKCKNSDWIPDVHVVDSKSLSATA